MSKKPDSKEVPVVPVVPAKPAVKKVPAKSAPKKVPAMPAVKPATKPTVKKVPEIKAPTLVDTTVAEVVSNSESYVIDVQEDKDGEMFIEFPENMMTNVGWTEGDVLTWTDNKDGSFSLTKQVKQPTEWVLVECVSTFRERYVVEVPKGKAKWALDTVSMEEAHEFSQEHLGEQIVSHRVVTKEEALVICDEDNAYTMAWTDEAKEKAFFTPWKEK
jgi:hypothetical protein